MSNQKNVWTQFLEDPNDCYAIFQVNHDEGELFGDRAKRIFSSMKEITALGLPKPAMDQYDAVYYGVLPIHLWKNADALKLLENLYEVFNVDRPEDFTGHSMSVSDVVALKLEGKTSFWFVDAISFAELEEFA